MSTTTNDPRARLRDIEAQLAELREERSDAIRERDTAAAALPASGQIDTTSPQARRVKAANAEVRRIEERIEELTTAQVEMLKRFDGHDHSADRGAVEALTSEPGNWLTSALHHRKRDVPTLPDSVRFSSEPLALAGPMAAATVTSADYYSVAESEALIDLLAPRSVAIESGIVVIPTTTTKTPIPKFTELPTAGWIAELDPFPISAPGVEMVEVQPPKVGVVSGLSLETFSDLTPRALALVQTNIVRAVALAFDAGILFGSGIAPEPRGVANSLNVLVETGTPTSLAVFMRALGALIGTNARPRVVVINPTDMGTLLEAVEFTGATTSNVPLLKANVAAPGFEVAGMPGVRWWITPACPVGEALMYDPEQIAIVLRQPAEVAVDPYWHFASGSANGDAGLRVYIRGDVVVGDPAGVCLIDLTGGSGS